MRGLGTLLASIFLALFLIFCVGACTAMVQPGFTAFFNHYEYVDKKVDDATNYETIKKVEDTCRSMISSYESDKMTYEQYKDSDNADKQEWAEQAKMRANKTASTYNNYILENSFVWADNVPKDIRGELEYLK